MSEEPDEPQSFLSPQTVTSQQNALIPDPLAPRLTDDGAPVNKEEDSQRVWNSWATIGWVMLAGVVVNILQALILVIYAVVKHGSDSAAITKVAEGAASNGFLISLLTCLTAPVIIGIVAKIAALRWPQRAGQYLALRPVAGREYLTWIGAALLLVVIIDGLTIASGRSIVPEFSRQIYPTAVVPALLWLALVVAAPLSEEIVFRGFMFRGLAASRAGITGAIVLTSLLWTAIHIQYDIFGLSSVFVSGLLLGWARAKTQSTYITIAIHCVMNLIATSQAALAYHMGERFPF